MLTQGYSGTRAYCQSKLAQILFTFDLAEELKARNVTVNCLHPATYMDTTMVRFSGTRPISTVEQGGAAILQLIESPALARKSGLYFNGLRESRADAQAYDERARKRLRPSASNSSAWRTRWRLDFSRAAIRTHWPLWQIRKPRSSGLPLRAPWFTRGRAASPL